MRYIAIDKNMGQVGQNYPIFEKYVTNMEKSNKREIKRVTNLHPLKKNVSKPKLFFLGHFPTK